MSDATSQRDIGTALELLCAESRRKLLLVAPFIKESILRRLLRGTNEGVDLSVVTRWRPHEISAGVSDLEVFNVVQENQGRLFLRQDLHAKYYRGDDHILVGSANVTAAALGWSERSNLELLVVVPSSDREMGDFERSLWPGAVLVDRSIHDIMQTAVEQCIAEEIRQPELAWQETSSEATDLEDWVPALRNPSDLYRAYAGDEDALASVALEAARFDLAILRPPVGLPEDAFHGVIAAMLVTLPVVQLIDRCVTTPQRFGHVRDVLRDHLGLSRNEASAGWQTLMRWLLYFLPNRYSYSRPGYSELISRVENSRS